MPKLLVAVSLLAVWIGQASGSDQKQKLPEYEQVQVTQAKNGNRIQLQELACELDFGTAVVQHNAIRKLGLVGGWFSINALSHLLSDDPQFTGSSSDAYGTFAPLQYQALQTLPKTVSNPPISAEHPLLIENHSSELKTWTSWLKENQESLKKLEPTGDGVVVSAQQCRNVLSKDLASTAYPIHKAKAPRSGAPQ